MAVTVFHCNCIKLYRCVQRPDKSCAICLVQWYNLVIRKILINGSDYNHTVQVCISCRRGVSTSTECFCNYSYHDPISSFIDIIIIENGALFPPYECTPVLNLLFPIFSIFPFIALLQRQLSCSQGKSTGWFHLCDSRKNTCLFEVIRRPQSVTKLMASAYAYRTLHSWCDHWRKCINFCITYSQLEYCNAFWLILWQIMSKYRY